MTKVRLRLAVLAFLTSAFISLSAPAGSLAAKLIFNSGFEADSQITGGYADISGTDRSVSSPNNWDNAWDFHFNYNGGNGSTRKAEIVDDPAGGNNKVLRLWLRDAYGGSVRSTSRIRRLGRTEWFSRRRVYVDPDFLLLSNYTGSSRVMFEEIKVTQTKTSPSFRITAAWGDIARGVSWDIEAEDLRASGPAFWTCTSRTSVPIGEWFTLETYYRAGDAKNGRYVLTFQRDGGSKQTICDVTNWTYHPDMGPSSPWTYNPMKLYMSRGDDVDWIRNNGGVAQLYFDDWEVWSTMPDGEIPLLTPTLKPTPTISKIPGGKFKVGDRVEVTVTANVKLTAGQGLRGTQPPGARGTVLGGPEIGIGGQSWWWEIDYDSWPDGWSREDLLKEVSTTTSTPTPIKTPTPFPTGVLIKGDLDGDGDVDIFDYNILVAEFGSTDCGRVADINGDCKVDIFDYNSLVENLGKN